MRIALFTPFEPETGGGGVIFRSLLPHLKDAEVRWFYLSNKPGNFPSSEHLGPSLLGGSFLRDGANSIRLFLMRSHSQISQYVKTIQNWSPDVAWVNAMNEGLLVASKLRDGGVKRLHISVHDDPAGLAQKSRRYRAFAPFIDGCNRDLLKRADSIDVVCEAMQKYYRERIGVSSGVVFRYIEEMNPPTITNPPSIPSVVDPIVRIGHVGSAYSAPEVFSFLNALRTISQADGTQFRLTNFGVSPAMIAAEREFPEIVENVGNVAEPEVILRLQSCRFVYSMYSFNPRHRVFRETSQPTKMSTYLMAARPIIAHCPEGSSTQGMLSKFNLGLCVTSMDGEQLVKGIRDILCFQLERDEVRRAREHYCGKGNLQYLSSCLGVS
jgi:hypothetical protein